MDADNYTHLPIGQYEEDNILRELNKCLLAFQQTQTKSEVASGQTQYFRQRRLSPIGESVSSSAEPQESNIPIITQQSCSTNKSRSQSPEDNNKAHLAVRNEAPKRHVCTEGVLNNRRGRFIVLGSSGECLPVKRKESFRANSNSSSSSSDEYHSAKASLDEGTGATLKVEHKIIND